MDNCRCSNLQPVETIVNEQTQALITTYIHMYEFFGGVSRILVSDNCTTSVDRKQSGWYTLKLNQAFHEFTEHYNTAIIPAHVQRPKEKPITEGSVGNISTWITAALRNKHFLSLSELNIAIRDKLRAFNSKTFQKGRQPDQHFSWGRKAVTDAATCHPL